MPNTTRKKVRADGSAIISAKRVRIHEYAYRAQTGLTRAEIPAAVREIGTGAFADNPELRTVRIQEGLRTIGKGAFAGNPMLTRLTLPDSLEEIACFVFADCPGIQESVFNRSKTVLYHYPQTAKDKCFQIPEGVHTIESTAFTENPWLEEVILPDTVTRLSFRSFSRSGIRTITIPAGIREIPEKTFVDCTKLREVILLGDTKIMPGAFWGSPEQLRILTPNGSLRANEKFWAIGLPVLKAELGELPDGSHTADLRFRTLAWGCGNGNGADMWAMGRYFDRLFCQEGHPFFSRAASFWKFMAYLSGESQADAWFARWEEENPDARMPALLDESRSGENLDGRYWNYLGYLHIEPQTHYDVHPTGNAGITLVRSYPYEADFWEAGLFCTTYLDEYLNSLPIGGVYQHPAAREAPNLGNPELFALMGKAITASLKRNGHKRKNNPYFLKFG